MSQLQKMGSTEYIIYCKRAILFLSSSKILTPHPPLPRRVCTPAFVVEGGHTRRVGEGNGGSIFWKTREIGLPSYSKICTLCSNLYSIGIFQKIHVLFTWFCDLFVHNHQFISRIHLYEAQPHFFSLSFNLLD